CQLKPVAASEDATGIGETGDQQSVPIGQHLVVEARASARRAGAEQGIAILRQLKLGSLVRAFEMAEAVENGLAFPIAPRGPGVELLEKRRAAAEDRIDLVFAPDIESTLLMLAIGIEARGETAVRLAHFPRQPADRLGDAFGIERALRFLPHRGQ